MKYQNYTAQVKILEFIQLALDNIYALTYNQIIDISYYSFSNQITRI